MFESFEIKNVIFDRLPHEIIHFELKIEGKEFEGHYNSEDEINWMNPKPDKEKLTVEIEDIETEIHKIMAEQIN